MLSLYLVCAFAFIFVLSVVKNSIRSILQQRRETKPTFQDSSSHSNKVSENLGLLFVLKTIVIAVLHSRKDPTHHETGDMKLYEHLKRCSKNYSSLQGTFFGITVVFPTSASSIREFLSSAKCGGRVPENFWELLSEDKWAKGIILAPNDVIYKEVRKYTIKTLGKLGFGKNSTMSVILDDTLNDFLKHLEAQRKYGGNKIQVHGLFSLSVVNIVWVIIGGQKFNENDEKFHKLENYVKTSVNEITLAFLRGNTIPTFLLNVLQWFGVKCTSLADLCRTGAEIFLEYIEEIESQRRDKESYEQTEDDFVNHFLSKIEKHKDDEELSKIYSKNQLVAVVVDLFAASVDSTSNFMESFIMYMVMYPEVQARMLREIKEVVGDSSPSYSDHSKDMPYTQAIIMEVHRMLSIIPVIPRYATQDCKIGSHTIKKNTWILNLQSMINLDETYWGDAKKFRPERFLDADNQILTEKVNYMIPFGAGLRVCPGENVAKVTIFTLAVGILQRYVLIKSDEKEFVGLRKSLSPTNGPEPFHVSLFPR